MATPNVKKYRKQVEVIDGLQYTGSNQAEVIEFTEGHAKTVNGKFVLEHPGGDLQEILVTNWITSDPFKNIWCIADSVFQIVYAPGP
jgi:hypothetical protein